MNEFKNYHPLVNFIYFLAVLIFSMLFMHPITIAISVLTGFTYSLILNGKKALKFNLIYMLPVMIFAAVLTPLFNHEGKTILAYFPSGNPLTLESVIYGLMSACMFFSVICHFSCVNKIMTSDKIMYLFGKITPGLSLILSMVLRFVPKFKSQMKAVLNAQKCIGKDASKGNVIKRAKNGIKVISIMITWSFENAIDTADSMKSRGYGTAKRSSYSNFRTDKRDIKAILYITLLSLYIILGIVCKAFYFECFPSIKYADVSLYEISVYIVYLLLFVCPIIIGLREIKYEKN